MQTGARTLQTWVVRIVVFSLPMSALAVNASGTLTPGVVLVALLSPLAWPWVRRYSMGRWAPVVVPVTLLVGYLLAVWSKIDHRDISTSDQTAIALMLFSVSSVSAGLLWGRAQIGMRQTVVLFAAGYTLSQALLPDRWNTNAWKYAFAWPVSVLVLGWVVHKSRRTQLLTLIALTAFTSTQNFRSSFALLTVATLLILWMGRRGRMKRPVLSAVLLGILGVGVYLLGDWMSRAGYLGTRNQEVTLQQTANGANLITGGRPESAALWQMFLQRPWGHGIGVIPSYEDVALGIASMPNTSASNADYAATYLFNGRFEFHSILGDAWSLFGIAGVLICLWAISVLLGSLIGGRTMDSGTALGVFLALQALWDLLFSPIGSNLLNVIAALALLVPLSTRKPLASQTGSRGRRTTPARAPSVRQNHRIRPKVTV